MDNKSKSEKAVGIQHTAQLIQSQCMRMNIIADSMTPQDPILRKKLEQLRLAAVEVEAYLMVKLEREDELECHKWEMDK